MLICKLHEKEKRIFYLKMSTATALPIFKFDQVVEITEKQFNVLRNEGGGYVATRQENGKFYVKPWADKIGINYLNRLMKNCK